MPKFAIKTKITGASDMAKVKSSIEKALKTIGVGPYLKIKAPNAAWCAANCGTGEFSLNVDSEVKDCKGNVKAVLVASNKQTSVLGLYKVDQEEGDAIMKSLIKCGLAPDE